MAEVKSAEDVLKVLKNSPLAAIVQAIESGEFGELQSYEGVGKNETPLGELTSIEKAILVVGNSFGKEANAIARANNDLIEEAEWKGEKINLAKIKENKATHQAMAEMHEAFEKLLWACIHKRLGPVSHEGRGIAIRSGYQLVRLAGGNGSDLSDFLDELLSGLESAVEKHDCGDCASYDECTLPFKKPRV